MQAPYAWGGRIVFHLFTSTVADLLGEGQSVWEVQAKFAPTMHAVDWATVRTTALAQAAPKKGK